jgi:very-short-patch-repair endonuclease
MAMEWQDPHDFAKHFKRAATPAGFLMWQLLRNRQRCGEKFRREYVKEPYILDFYCPGKQHVSVVDLGSRGAA